MSIFKSFLFISFIFSSAWALPLPKGNQFPVTLPLTFTGSYNFEGIVSLSNCSGSLVRFENSQDTDMAMVLTNGHCLEGGFVRPNEVIVDQVSNRSFSILDSQGSTLGRVGASRIIYATMTKTDMTLYRLQTTFAAIKKDFGISPLTMASTPPQINDSIEVISGYWRRGYACGVERFVTELREANWIFADSLRYTRPGCETVGGTSGSPVILAGTRTVVGVNNTGNEDGFRCTMNNPCEVDSSGSITFEKGVSYGQQTYWVYSCLETDGSLNLKKPGCLLPH